MGLPKNIGMALRLFSVASVPFPSVLGVQRFRLCDWSCNSTNHGGEYTYYAGHDIDRAVIKLSYLSYVSLAYS